jgi:hypothetical protein
MTARDLPSPVAQGVDGMKKSRAGLDALTAITDKVLAYHPRKKNKKAHKRQLLPKPT